MSKQTIALNIKGLNKVYKNGVEAVKNIDLEVQKGDFFALLGPNGAGKSTTIGVISSLVNKTAGEVEVFGHNIDTHLEAAKSELGLVPQEFNFSQFETLTQILVNQAGYYGVPRKLAHERADKYLTQLGLLDKKDKQARTLSGGMKRRLMIARALMHEPKLLILDEPTAGVDIELRRSMWDFLRQINEQGVTIILTTHYLEEAELLCKNIAIIDSGIIVENTTIKALLAKLDKETFILDLKQPVQAVTLDGYQFSMVDDHTIEVEVAKAQGLNAVFSALTEQGNTVLSMRNKANRLEELFVGLLEQGREK
ncbi:MULTISPECIES: ABC transporter ATP-binding protein [unclassified Pseudoalteromonas]|uniref:ABC transporter ATP-binding protein n=1 Tax=unclassified Pseudoalteromonas TaxID=194690 RepID=UPI000B3CDB9E|nr:MULTISPECIES: ABC transporter ATP-binding protein [unclassified Pseudoalteromonas]MDN3378277.1 ABC transporter ATP-binding protein [Pseudoalteromonas sp. APC 3893]MDN3386197.1 ABC transporter ATP-binding protein [Pseudoalteromonas sp. APC 4017]OUS70163.1 ABC transporter [Pseudoalteromonas sp. A601]